MRGVLLAVFAFAYSVISLCLFAQELPRELEVLGAAKKFAEIKQQPKEVARWGELPSWPTSLAFSPDDKTLAIGLKERVQFVDLVTNAMADLIELRSGQVRSLAFSPDGSMIAAGSYQCLTILRAEDRTVVRELKGHRGYVTGIAFSSDGQRLATSCEDELARIWMVAGDAPPILLKGHSYPVTGVAWSPDGSVIATSAGDDTRPTKPGQVRLWDANSGALLNQFELHQKAATGVNFSRDGRYLLSSSFDEHVNVYDLVNKKPLGFFSGHSRPTNSVVVHPDGKTAISISGGRAVGKNELIAWTLETGEPVAGIEAHTAKIATLALSHNGRLVATGGQDRSVALWSFDFLSVGERAEKP